MPQSGIRDYEPTPSSSGCSGRSKWVPKLEQELKFAKERIEKLELRGVQTTEMRQQSMNQLGERLARLKTQPQGLSQLPVTGTPATDPLKEEHGRRIQELQIWVQALNGGTSALLHPRNWENPLSVGYHTSQKSVSQVFFPGAPN